MTESTKTPVGIIVIVAQAERKMISQQRRQLSAAKGSERVVDLRPIIADVKTSGASSLRQIAAGLNGRGIPTARGGAWSAVQVKRVLERA